MQMPDNASTTALAATQTFVVTGLGALLLDQRVVSLLMLVLAIISFVLQAYYRHKEYKAKLLELEIKYGKLQQASKD